MVDNGGHDRWIDLNGPQIRQLRQSAAVDSLVAMGDWSMTMTGHELPEDMDATWLPARRASKVGADDRAALRVEPRRQQEPRYSLVATFGLHGPTWVNVP